MKCLNVNLVNNPYPIVITDNFRDFLSYTDDVSNKCIIITDRNVEKFHLKAFVGTIRQVYSDVLFYIVEAGEKSKCLNIVQDIYQFLIKNNICRNDVIISLGGGVIGDLAGFVASTFMRGIQLIHVPTSLLAQNDSSIGGKTSVDLKSSKNIIGAFYQPKLVYINCNVLKTLPETEIRNGLTEVLVHAIIKDANLFSYIEENLDKIVRLDPFIIESLIYWNCRIKASVVEKDEKDQGERAILNFGHTFGHAIESAYNYQYRHGECVALGILGAFFISEELNFTEKSITKKVTKLLYRLGVLRNIQDCDIERVLYYLKHDKKVVSETIFFILPLDIGKVVKHEITNVNIILKALYRVVEYSSKFK